MEAESIVSVAKLTNASTFDIVTDHLGTPLSMHQASAEAVWSADLDSYGQVRNLRGKAEGCPFRFPGQYEDVETGLYYNRFRYYDPREGVYVSQDPIGLWGGMNLFAYVQDPTVRFDAFGLSCNHYKYDKTTNIFRDAITGRFVSKAEIAKNGQISIQKQAGHIIGTPQQLNRAKVGKYTSTFASRAEADALTREALVKGSPVPGQPGKFEHDFGGPIGRGPNGGNQNKIRVHVDQDAIFHGHPSGPEY
jgi:RHS repeat-associated protein